MGVVVGVWKLRERACFLLKFEDEDENENEKRSGHPPGYLCVL
jgi:hypothetical protein